jgi:hypothetical protein
MRILDTVTVEVPIVLTDETVGNRIITREGIVLSDDSRGTYARAARYAIATGFLVGKVIAWIGGGLCVGPRLFATSKVRQTIFEANPSFAEFCPPGLNFVPGDWRVNIVNNAGPYDVIVYDLRDTIPTAELTPYLTPTGIILGEQ